MRAKSGAKIHARRGGAEALAHLPALDDVEAHAVRLALREDLLAAPVARRDDRVCKLQAGVVAAGCGMGATEGASRESAKEAGRG